MIEPKKDVYTILSELGITVYQIRPEVIAVFPSISFYVSNNTPEYDLSKGIGRQNIEITVDIWGKNSKETSPVLSTLEAKMNEYNYLMIGNLDIPDPDGYSHISTRFIY